MECAWQVEKDKDCNRVLANRFPKIERFSDVTKCGRMPRVDVLCGGFPCQDLSVAGKRAGLAGERSGLWFEFLRIAQVNKPRTIVIENVPGLLSSDEHRDFAIILRGLVECGYCLAWRVLDAQFYGVAQRRRRVFIVGSLGNGSCAQILFESESVSWNPPTRGEARAGVANAVTTGTGKSSGPRNGNGEPMHLINVAATLDQRGRGPTDAVMMNLQVTAHTEIASTLNAAYAKKWGLENQHIDQGAPCFVTHALRSEGADASEDGTGRGTPLVVEAVDVRNLRMQPDGISGTMQHKKSGGYSLNYQNPVLIPPDVELWNQTCGCGNEFIGPLSQPCPHCGEIREGMTHGNPIAFSSKDYGADAGDVAPTLRAQNFDKSHINGGGQVAIAFGWNKSESQTMRVDEETTDALQSSATSNPAIAFHENKSGQISEAETLGLRAGASHSYQGVGGSFGVRRLTPRECERLQGFPDDFTRWDAKGKEISDSARYRMLGNAVAVPCAEWLGKRIVAKGKFQ